MLKDLIKIATTLDSMGLAKEADQIDYLIKKIATDSSRIEQLYNDEMIMGDVKFILRTELEASEIRSGRHEVSDYVKEIMNKRDRAFARLESRGVSKEDIDALEKYEEEQENIWREANLTSLRISGACSSLRSSLSNLKNTKYRVNKIRANSDLNQYASDITRIFEEKDPDIEIDRYIELTKSIVKLIQSEDYNAAKEKALDLLNKYRAVWSHYMKDAPNYTPGKVFQFLYEAMFDLKKAIERGLDEVIPLIESGRVMTENQRAEIKSRCDKIINKQEEAD